MLETGTRLEEASGKLTPVDCAMEGKTTRAESDEAALSNGHRPEAQEDVDMAISSRPQLATTPATSPPVGTGATSTVEKKKRARKPKGTPADGSAAPKSAKKKAAAASSGVGSGSPLREKIASMQPTSEAKRSITPKRPQVKAGAARRAVRPIKLEPIAEETKATSRILDVENVILETCNDVRHTIKRFMTVTKDTPDGLLRRLRKAFPKEHLEKKDLDEFLGGKEEMQGMALTSYWVCYKYLEQIRQTNEVPNFKQNIPTKTKLLRHVFLEMQAVAKGERTEAEMEKRLQDMCISDAEYADKHAKKIKQATKRKTEKMTSRDLGRSSSSLRMSGDLGRDSPHLKKRSLTSTLGGGDSRPHKTTKKEPGATASGAASKTAPKSQATIHTFFNPKRPPAAPVTPTVPSAPIVIDSAAPEAAQCVDLVSPAPSLPTGAPAVQGTSSPRTLPPSASSSAERFTKGEPLEP